MIFSLFQKFKDLTRRHEYRIFYTSLCNALFSSTLTVTSYFQFQTQIHLTITELCLHFINCCVRLNLGFIVDSASIVYLVLPVRSQQRCNSSIIHTSGKQIAIHILNLFQQSQTPLRSVGGQFRPKPLNPASLPLQ